MTTSEEWATDEKLNLESLNAIDDQIIGNIQWMAFPPPYYIGGRYSAESADMLDARCSLHIGGLFRRGLSYL